MIQTLCLQDAEGSDKVNQNGSSIKGVRREGNGFNQIPTPADREG